MQLLLVPFSKFLVVAGNVLVVYALAQHAFAPVLPQTFFVFLLAFEVEAFLLRERVHQYMDFLFR